MRISVIFVPRTISICIGTNRICPFNEYLFIIIPTITISIASSYTPPDPKEDLTQASFTSHFNTGYSTVFFAGHGNPYQFIRNPSGGIAYTNANADSCTNSNMSSLVYAFACTTSPFDQNDNNIGEILIKRDNAGAIGFVGGLRITWYFEYDINLEKLNRGNAKLFWEEFFEGKKYQQGKALYDSKVAYMNSDYFDDPSVSMKLEYERKNVLTYCLLGDPELDVYTGKPIHVKNPFEVEIYEGQNISFAVKNIYDAIIPYARLSITSDDGLYRTFYTDVEGHLNFTIPALKDKEYNITITGHNIKPSQFNLTTQLDTIDPEINNLQIIQDISNEVDTIYFNTEAHDLYSGIENVFLLLSNNSFENFGIYTMEKNLEKENNNFEIYLNSLPPGKYLYLAIARDYANNTTILYEDDFNFEIIQEQNENDDKYLIYFLIFLSIIGLTGIFIFIKNKIKNDNWVN